MEDTENRDIKETEDSESRSNRIRKTMGESIRNIRIENGLTISELSDYLGITPGFLGLVERGKRGLTLNKILKFTEKFGITTDELFFTDADRKARTNTKSTMLEKILFMAKQLSEEEQQRLITIIKAAFPWKTQ